ncbi:hypothetical protein DKT74_25720, partial [Streptomyces sp. ZEA17I]
MTIGHASHRPSASRCAPPAPGPGRTFHAAGCPPHVPSVPERNPEPHHETEPPHPAQIPGGRRRRRPRSPPRVRRAHRAGGPGHD